MRSKCPPDTVWWEENVLQIQFDEQKLSSGYNLMERKCPTDNSLIKGKCPLNTVLWGENVLQIQSNEKKINLQIQSYDKIYSNKVWWWVKDLQMRRSDEEEICSQKSVSVGNLLIIQSYEEQISSKYCLIRLTRLCVDGQFVKA